MQPFGCKNIQAADDFDWATLVTTRTNPPEDVPDQAVSQLNESLKSCQKVVSHYRAALLKKPAAERKRTRSD